MTTAFVLNRNRLTYTQQIVRWLMAQSDVWPVIVDIGSDYQPLLAWYAGDCPCEVIHMGVNYGHTVLWQPVGVKLLDEIVKEERYIVTDSDLDLTRVPDDWLKVLNRGLDLYPEFDKCGFSLEINDLPQTEEGKRVRYEFERAYWLRPLDDLYFNAPIDTTFALYRERVRVYSYKAIRTNRPYTARHLPWYYTCAEDIPEDERYHLQHAHKKYSSGKSRFETYGWI